MDRNKFHILLFLLFTLLYSCKEESEPLIKQYPMLQTLPVSNVDTAGTIFNGEFINLGLEEVDQYGFIIITDEYSLELSDYVLADKHIDTVLITENPAIGHFSAFLNNSLIGNFNYYVKAFAKTTNHIIYGNTVQFKSKGSQWEPWSLVEENVMVLYLEDREVFAESNGNIGFIYFNTGDFYSYDPITNIVSGRPEPQFAYEYYASFCINNYIYFIEQLSGYLVRYDIIQNLWTLRRSVPFPLNRDNGFECFAINNTGYCLTSDGFYSYDEMSDLWINQEHPFSTYFNSVQVVGNEAFVFSDVIWKYSPESNHWIQETRYPGKRNSKIVGFSLNSKLYYGLSYDTYSGRAAQDMWEYSPKLKTWKRMEDFPMEHSRLGVFSLSFNSIGYLGFNTLNPFVLQPWNADFTFAIFKFDPKKMKNEK